MRQVNQFEYNKTDRPKMQEAFVNEKNERVTQYWILISGKPPLFF